MKKLLILGMLALAGCAGVPTSSADISAKAKEIQGYTKLACSFVPTIGTIANILSSGTSIPLMVIASDICAAITTTPLADGGPRVPKLNYNGKVITIRGSKV